MPSAVSLIKYLDVILQNVTVLTPFSSRVSAIRRIVDLGRYYEKRVATSRHLE